jgi:hypothetical protein
VVQPSVSFDVLGIAAAFFGADHIIVFNKVESGDLEAIGVKISAPAEDGLGESVDVEHIVFGKEEGEKKGVFIDDDSAAAAKASDDGNFVPLDFLDVEKNFRLAGDAHHDCAGRAAVDDANIEVRAPEQGLFNLELFKDGRRSKIE